MKTIVEGNSKISKLLGEQRVTEKNYRLMKYLIRLDCEDGVLLHNSVTGQLVLLNNEESKAIQNLPCVQNECITDLIKGHYLVPVDYDEKEIVHKIRILLRKLFSPKYMDGYTILTTTNCNARCFYCYESDYPRVNMDKAMADKIVDYMVLHKGKGPLKISWFGGEPLVGIARIDQISNRLHDLNIEFSSTMITNGYLFDKPIVQRAAQIWNLKTVQITLDGTEEIYNRTKSYINANNNPFRRVFDNIALLLKEKIHVLIRLNLDQHNVDDLNCLIEQLYNSFNMYENFEVYVHVLFENEGFTPIKRDSKNREELYLKEIALNDHLEKMGLKKRHTSLPVLKDRYCMADGDGAVCINPDGYLFKCEHTGVRDAFGHIERGITDECNIQKFRETVELENCSECPIYPSCILLSNCNGLMDHNSITCKSRIERAVHCINDTYRIKNAQLVTGSEDKLEINC